MAASYQRKRLPVPGRDASTCGRRGCRERIGADETPREGGSGTLTALASTRGRASQSARWLADAAAAHITTIISAKCRRGERGEAFFADYFCYYLKTFHSFTGVLRVFHSGFFAPLPQTNLLVGSVQKTEVKHLRVFRFTARLVG